MSVYHSLRYCPLRSSFATIHQTVGCSPSGWLYSKSTAQISEKSSHRRILEDVLALEILHNRMVWCRNHGVSEGKFDKFLVLLVRKDWLAVMIEVLCFVYAVGINPPHTCPLFTGYAANN